MLGDHEVQLVQVLGLGQVAAQRRPQVVVLGGVVDLQGLAEGGPALGCGAWPAGAAFELGGEGLEASRITAKPGVDGPHEAEAGRAVDQHPSAPPSAAHLRVPGVAFLLALLGYHSTRLWKDCEDARGVLRPV